MPRRHPDTARAVLISRDVTDRRERVRLTEKEIVAREHRIADSRLNHIIKGASRAAAAGKGAVVARGGAWWFGVAAQQSE